MRVLCPTCNSATKGLHGNPHICGHCRNYIPDAPRNEAAEAIAPKPQRKAKPRVELAETVRPLNVTIPKSAPRKSGGIVTALLYGDSHFPHQDESALAIVQAIAEDTQPDFLVHVGDLLDCYSLSRYDKDPKRKETLQDEIDQARMHLATMRLASPKSRFLLLEGNHEDRLRRTLWNLDGPASVLASLTAFNKAMSWPALLGTEEMGVEFIPANEQTKQTHLPKFILKHGTVVRPTSGATAAGEWKKYSKSGASGHTHRLGQFYHRDQNGNHVWVETGCTCSITPDYTLDPDWQQGAVFMSFEEKTGAFQAETIYIHNGLAVFRGRCYGAKAAA